MAAPSIAAAVTFQASASGIDGSSLSGVISFANYGDVIATSYHFTSTGGADWDPADPGGLSARSWTGNQLNCLQNNTADLAAPGQSLRTLAFVGCGSATFGPFSGQVPVTFTELIVEPPTPVPGLGMIGGAMLGAFLLGSGRRLLAT